MKHYNAQATLLGRSSSQKSTFHLMLNHNTSQYYHRALGYEDVLNIKTEFSNPIENISIFNSEHAENAANTIRQKWNLGNDPIQILA